MKKPYIDPYTSAILVDHAKRMVHEENVGTFFRTARSGAYTNLARVRTTRDDQNHPRKRDGQRQAAASRSRVVSSPHPYHPHAPIRDPNNFEEAKNIKHEIERIHEHRSLRSKFTA